MIYLQNRLQQLNGNKVKNLFLLFVWALIISSCSTIFPSRSSKPEDISPITDKKNKEDFDHGKMDTIKWVIEKDVPHKVEPKVVTPKENAIEPLPLVKEKYRVGVLLPLYSDQKERVLTNDNIKSIMHFYLGMQLALQQYSKGIPKIEFDFIDIESKQTTIASLIRNQTIKDYDLVIGPYKTVDIQAVNEYCAPRNIPVISPWNPGSAAASSNNSYIQLKPSLKTHATHIINYIAEHKRGQKILIVASQADQREIDNFKLFKEAAIAVNRGLFIQEVLIDNSLAPSKNPVIKQYIDSNQEVVMIIPYFSNWQFVGKILNSILAEYPDKSPLVTFIGLPQMIENENIAFNLLDKLNVLVSTGPFFDLSDEKVNIIRSSFFEKYRAVPLEDAYYGHDIANWVVNHIKVNGTEFNPFKTKKVRQIGVNDYSLNLEFGDRSVSDDFKNYNHLENHSLQMVRLVDYKFQKVN
jgi:hypothetical protein